MLLLPRRGALAGGGRLAPELVGLLVGFRQQKSAFGR